ncbi:NUDIX domain-containing protein [Dactylosporangium siamense]|uniref:NUDIX hydrolase n=1 Tax=Dactylosporangium siamense TaxID=685454 RepID=A0A919PWI2_9ACTN|nr:NUDIX domain-containing protein [Dactylosporangium siamense]GIG51574.1 NUDIX hydrolase [Dactylosporangium siamense]
MGIPDYIRVMRTHIGHDLLLLPGVGAIVVDDRGRLLFARRSDTGRWAVVAGMVEPGEQPADTIVREVHEETGVDVTVERILGVATHPVDYPNGDRCEYLSITFLCRAVGGTARVNDDESLDVGWFEPTELPELEPYSRLRVEMALRDAKEAWFAPVGSRHPALVEPSM